MTAVVLDDHTTVVDGEGEVLRQGGMRFEVLLDGVAPSDEGAAGVVQVGRRSAPGDGEGDAVRVVGLGLDAERDAQDGAVAEELPLQGPLQPLLERTM
jgi:hypothetical protein